MKNFQHSLTVCSFESILIGWYILISQSDGFKPLKGKITVKIIIGLSPGWIQIIEIVLRSLWSKSGKVFYDFAQMMFTYKQCDQMAILLFQYLAI